jgi:chromosome segregation ATPase
VKLSEVMLFVEWLKPAMAAIENGIVMPDPPQLGPGDVSGWIQTIRTLEDRRREGEEVRLSLEAEMRDREAYVGRLTQQLQTSIAEAKSAQGTLQEVQREVAGHKEILAQVAELVNEVARFDGHIRSAASEMLSKSTQLDTLTGSFKELAESLKSAISKSPSK